MSNETFSPQILLDPTTQTQFFVEFGQKFSPLIEDVKNNCDLQNITAYFTSVGKPAFFCRDSDLDHLIFPHRGTPSLRILTNTINGFNSSAWECIKSTIMDWANPALNTCKPYTDAQKATYGIINTVGAIFLLVATILVVAILSRVAYQHARTIAIAKDSLIKARQAVPSERTPLRINDGKTTDSSPSARL